MNWNYVIQRLSLTVVVLLGVTFAVFSIIQLVPGDPARVVLGVQANEENTAALRERLGLNRHWTVQYISWLAGDDWFTNPVLNEEGEAVSNTGTNKGILRGDFGDSLITRQPVGPQLADRLPATLQLAVAALLVGLMISFPLGIMAAVNRGGPVDIVASLISQIGVSMPDFWLGILLVLLFSLELDWLPPSGYDEPSEGVWEWFEHLILPAVTAGVISGAIMTRFIRSAMIEVLQSNYIRTAYAKGVPGWRVITSHALRNALINIVTIIGLADYGPV